MSEQLAASTVRPPSFREMALEAIADSRETRSEERVLPDAPRHGVTDLRDLLVVAERRPGSVSLVDTTRHECVGRIDGVGRAPHSIVFHRQLPANDREGAYAYVQSRQGWVSKLDLFGGELVARIRAGTSGRAIAISAGSAFLIAGYYNPNHAVILDADTLEPLHRIPAHAVDADGQSIASRICTVRDVPGERCFLLVLKDAGTVWFVDYGEPEFPIVDEIDVGRVLHDGVFSPDDRYFYLASQAEDCLYVLDVRQRTVVGRVPTAGPPHPSPGALDERRGLGIMGTVMTDAVTAWDLETWEPIADVRIPGHGMFCTAHPDSEYVWGDVVFDDTDRDNDGFIYQIDPDELVVSTVIDTTEWADGRSLHPEFTRDGDHVYVSCWDAGTLLVFNSSTGAFTAAIDGMETPTGTFLGDRATEP
ncbi:cytochrome D1 domain-containing protein [Natrinema gari]|uniref:Cytochrome d1, heme region n=1 Tax=Natrinema gari JCM 14663 TaxID=1230459 RepID=L9ZBF8_9EURY|nr:cytochrome D1 domain-containing protein [Natrinema gari]ELY82942.1 cytochrome d1, heme region [Natrinema gari JCM 14663]